MSESEEPRWLARALRLITEVRPGEATTALLLTLNVFLLLTAYYLIKPVREALILALDSGAEYKSYMSGVIAVSLIFAVPAYAKVADRFSRGKLVIGVTLFFGLHLVLFFGAGLSAALRPHLGLIFFLWVGIFNMMVVTQFWSFANDIYDPERGKRLFPLLALGATFGAVAGSWISRTLIPLFAAWFSPATGATNERESIAVYPLLLVAAGVLVICALLFRVVDRREGGGPEALAAAGPKDGGGAAKVPVRGAFQIVFQHRYLLLLAGFSLVFSWVNSNGEYLLGKLIKAAALEAVGRGEIAKGAVGDYIGVAYGEFFFYVNILALVLQSVVVSRLIRKFGLGPAFFVLPVIALCDASAVAILPVLAILRIGKIAENATDYSLNNTLRQMLWLVTTREMKYKAKQAVDTFFVRMGDVSSAVLVWFGAAVIGLSVRGFSFVNAILVVIWLVLAAAIVREHGRLAAERAEHPPLD